MVCLQKFYKMNTLSVYILGKILDFDRVEVCDVLVGEYDFEYEVRFVIQVQLIIGDDVIVLIGNLFVVVVDVGTLVGVIVGVGE